jgi:hypothetical protein
MNTKLKAIAGLVLVSAVTAATAQTTPATAGTKKKATAHRVRRAARPTVESQIDALRNDMNSQRTQIDSLRQQLTDRDTQLQQAQQAAAAAQAAAQQAQQAAQQQQQTLSDNTQAVGSLQTAVSDLKSSSSAAVASIQQQQAAIHHDIENPDVIHYKGVVLSPVGSFIEAATVNRTRATASDIPTPFNAIPFSASNAGQISEFYGTGRQSRLALNAEGHVSNGVIRGYYEMDWLGTGVTSNNNQSNSYVMRQRQLWAQAQLNNGWTFTGGQMWSLVTETRTGMDNKTEVLPGNIDPNYNVGFVWTRQYAFRVTHNFGNTFWVGASAENPQTLTPSCSASTGGACPTNYLIGASGTGGGLYNSTTTYSYNLAPDIIAKLVFQPHFGGHYELFGISRFFRDRVYPNAGAATPSAAGAYNDRTTGGGIGGGFRIPALGKRVELALHGLYGEGIGRYGTSTLPDTTLRPDGQLALLHGFSSLAEIVAHPTKRLDLYVDYGGDYVGRRYFFTGTGTAGYGSPALVNSGCGTEGIPGSGGYSPSGPSHCAGTTKDTEEATFGWWYNIYAGSHGRLRQGFQYSYVDRNTWWGVGGTPKANDQVIETSLRYYLP